jgi:hypothetical protein
MAEMAASTTTRRTHRRLSFLILALVVFAGIVIGVRLVVNRIDRAVKDAHSGPMHVFKLASTPAFLTDEIALSKAREALSLDGYDTSAWQPGEDDRSKAPDGTPDRYLVRNTLDPNRGSIRFLDKRVDSRYVQVELKGDRVHCQVIIPK